ncbi:hypothetical protein EAE96_007556 [Botrytis aclada]|nr:hypothetical protein EAE96_007556 [Botrytis aclada]
MSEVTTEIEYLSISIPGGNNHSPGSIISSGMITQQPSSDNYESTTIPAPLSIRKWRWPKSSERRKKAETLDTSTNANTNTNTNTNTKPNPLPPAQHISVEWRLGNEFSLPPSQNTTPTPTPPSPSSSSSPSLSLTDGFEKYWEDISDEEMTTHIPPNIIEIWKRVVAAKLVHARAAGTVCAEIERELREEAEEKCDAMARDRREGNMEGYVERLLEMVEECDLFGWVKERGRRAFWKGGGVR